MNSLTIMGIIWIFYGTLGLFGIQNIPDKFKVPGVEKEYKKFSGKTWLIQGVLWVIFGIAEDIIDFNMKQTIIIAIILLIPVVVYSLTGQKKFEKILKEFNEQ